MPFGELSETARVVVIVVGALALAGATYSILWLIENAGKKKQPVKKNKTVINEIDTVPVEELPGFSAWFYIENLAGKMERHIYFDDLKTVTEGKRRFLEGPATQVMLMAFYNTHSRLPKVMAEVDGLLHEVTVFLPGEEIDLLTKRVTTLEEGIELLLDAQLPILEDINTKLDQSKKTKGEV